MAGDAARHAGCYLRGSSLGRTPLKGMRSGGRVVEGARLESEYTPKAYRGFESLPLRQPPFSELPITFHFPCISAIPWLIVFLLCFINRHHSLTHLGAQVGALMLTDLLIKNATANGKDYKLSDSGGLHLFVSKSGHRSWRLKYRFGGKERRLMIGSYPDVSLKEARERRNVARTLLVNGRDPGIEAQRAKVERTLAAANDFETVARAWFELQKGRWTPIHASDVINSLEKAVFPWIGKLPVKEIDEPLLLSVLRKVERRGAIETAHRVRQRISAIFVHAIAEGMVARDPATVITKALKPVPRSRKGPALLALDAIHDLIRKTECEPASPITKLASRFMAYRRNDPE